MSTPVDLSRAYAWVRRPVLVERDATTVQIGAEPADSLVLRHAPPGAVTVLEQLDGTRPLGELLAAGSASPDAWAEVAAVLLEAGLLRGATELADGAGATGLPIAEATFLTSRLGRVPADRVARARRDALVVIHDGALDGAVRIAGARGPTTTTAPDTGVRDADALTSTLEDVLALSGVGHLHRPGSRRDATAAAVRDSVTRAHPDTARVSRVAGARGTERLPRRDRPAGHQLPAVAVLTGAAARDLALAATLTLARVPHLAVTAAGARAVVGPLVLPGRSSCLWCLHRHRVDADAAWPAVVRAAARAEGPATAVVGSLAGTLAAHQVLTLIDGLAVPASVDGTLEWSSDGVATRRRTWTPHPECACGATPAG